MAKRQSLLWEQTKRNAPGLFHHRLHQSSANFKIANSKEFYHSILEQEISGIYQPGAIGNRYQITTHPDVGMSPICGNGEGSEVGA